MEARRLLLIDDDPKFRDLVSSHLLPYGFEVVVADNSDNPLGQVKVVKPELIMIAVELPDKLGFALCNKAKKGVAKRIPVVLTTASLSQSGFLSHRKIRSHADEYLDKRTLSSEELMDKIDHLVGLGELVDPAELDSMMVESIAIETLSVEVVESPELVAVGSQPPPPPPGASEEIEVDLGSELEVEVVEEYIEDDGFGADEFPADATAVAPMSLLDGIDDEADAALDALEMFDESAAPPVAASDPRPGATLDLSIEDVMEAAPNENPFDSRVEFDETGLDDIDLDDVEDDVVVEEIEYLDEDEPEIEEIVLDDQPSEHFGSVTEDDFGAKVRQATETGSDSTPDSFDADSSLDFGLEQVESAARQEQSGIYSPQALSRIRESEEETERLREALNNLRSQKSSESGSQSRQREFLNLRERINAREKEIDRITERAVAAETKLTSLDDDLGDANRTIEMFESTRGASEAKLRELKELAQSSNEVVAQLQARIEEIRVEKEAAEAERNEEREATSEMTTALSRSRAELEQRDQTISDAAIAAEALRSEHAETISKLEARILDLDAKGNEALEKVRADHHAELDATQQRSASAEQEAARTVATSKAEAAEEIEAAKTAAAAEIETAKAEAAAEAEAAKSEAAAEIEGAKTEAAAEIEDAKTEAAAEAEAVKAGAWAEAEAAKAKAETARAEAETARAEAETARAEAAEEIAAAKTAATAEIEDARAEAEAARFEAAEEIGAAKSAAAAEIEAAKTEAATVAEAAKTAAAAEIERLRREAAQRLEEVKVSSDEAIAFAESEKTGALQTLELKSTQRFESLKKKHVEELDVRENEFAEQFKTISVEHEDVLSSAKNDLVNATQQLDAIRGELEQTSASHQNKLAELETSYQAEIETRKGELATRQSEIASLKASHVEALESQRFEFENAQRTALAESAAAHEAAIEVLKSEQTLAVETIVGEHHQVVTSVADAKDVAFALARSEHDTAIANLRESLTSEHLAALEAVNEQFQERAQSQQATHRASLEEAAASLEMATASHRDELEAAAEENSKVVTALKASFDSERQELELDKRQELDATIAEIQANNRADNEAALAEQKAASQAALAEASEASEAALETLRAEMSSALETAIADKDAFAAEIETKKTEEVQALADQYEGRVVRLKRERDETVEQVKTENEAMLAEAIGVHTEAVELLRQENSSAIDRLSAKHREALESAHASAKQKLEEAQRVHAQTIADEVAERESLVKASNAQLESELGAAAQAKEKALSSAEDRRQRELDEAAEARAAAENELVEGFETTKTQIERDHADAVGLLSSEMGELKEALGSSREAVSSVQANLEAEKAAHEKRAEELAAGIAGLKTDLGERDKQLIALRSEVDELEEENAQFQEQVLKAYQKIKSDEARAAKSKKALAIALTLLDEQDDESVE